MTLPYDPSRTALFHPEQSETVFSADAVPELPALAVEAARLAYYRAETDPLDTQRLGAALARAHFHSLTQFVDPHVGTYAFAALRDSDNLALLAFRGSQPDDVTDLGNDVSAVPVPWEFGAGQVHAGFASAYASIHTPIGQWLTTAGRNRRLVFTGHSLGAALATLAAAAYRPDLLVTLGGPHVGNARFCAALADVATTRLVNCCDIVTRLPPRQLLGYEAAGLPTYIDREGAVLFNPTDEFVTADQQAARARYFVDHAWTTGSVLFRDLADHAPANYQRAFFQE